MDKVLCIIYTTIYTTMVVYLVLALEATETVDLAVKHNPQNRGSARDFVYETLRYSILHLKLKPGTKMSEQDVSDQFQVSRTPIREVFVRLFQEELVEIYPQRGTYVSLINLRHLEEGRFVRETMEKAVIREAAGELSKSDLFKLESNLAAQEVCRKNRNYFRMLALDDEFHATIFRACGMERTWSTVQQLNNDFYRVRVLRLAHDFRWDTILSQHYAIFEALKNGEGDRAEGITQDHLRMVIVEKDELKLEYPDYFVDI